jgi:hypothetical protein
MRIASWFALGALAASAWADEGKWTPQQLLQFDPAWLKQQGLELPVSRLWDPQRGTGLLAATVSTGGCSGGFVTATGLFLTNHHCLFGIVQEHSRLGRDLITNGFIAHTREEELPGKTMRITVPHKFTDVTKEVLAAAQGQLAGLARGHIIDKQKAADDAVIAWAAKQPAYAKARDAKRELDRLASERRAGASRDFLFQTIRSGAVALRVATTLVRLAAERPKPDAEREPDYMERQWKSLRNAMEREQQSFYRPSDEALLADWIARVGKFAPGDVASWYASTRVTDPAERLKMFDESTEQLRARKDPMLDLAFALEPELRQWQKSSQTFDGAVA